MQRLLFHFARTPDFGPTGSDVLKAGLPVGPGRWAKRVQTALFFVRLMCAAVVFVGFASQSGAATLPTIKLAWNANPERNLAGYELSYGTVPGAYPFTIYPGLETTAKVSGLSEGVTYYFTVLARNKAGIAGPRSAIVTYRVDARVAQPPSGTIISPATDLTITTGDSVDFSAKASDPNDGATLSYLWNFGGSGIADTKAKSPGSMKFTRAGIYRITFNVTNSLGKADPTPATRTIVVKDPYYAIIPRSGWKLKYVDSQETKGYAATAAFDGNTSTFWHTKFKRVKLVKEPHEIQIDMGAIRDVSGFQYLPRQDGLSVGNVGKFNFYVSKNGKNWGKPVASGTFGNTTELKQIYFKAKRARYVRLQSVTEVSGNTDCNVAELQVLQLLRATATSPSAAESLVLAAVAGASSVSKVSSAPPLSSVLAPDTATVPVPRITTEIIDGKKYRAITVTKPTLPDDVKRTVEVSADLLDWFSGKKHTTVLIDNDQLLKVRDNTPVTQDGKRYIRLKETPR